MTTVKNLSSALSFTRYNKSGRYNSSFPRLVMFLLLALLVLNAAAQKKDSPGRTVRTLAAPKPQYVVIKGNIRQLNLMGPMTDALAFAYQDLVTGEDVIIPIERDSAGNYSVKVPVTGVYQQVELLQGEKFRGEVHFGGLIQHSFYVKPGNLMTYNYYRSPDGRERTVNFKGDMAIINGRDEEYQRALSSAGFSSLIDYQKLDSVKGSTYPDFKEYVAKRLHAALSVKNTYFKAHPADPFLRQQADNDLRYEAANLVLQGIFRSKTNDSGLAAFLRENNIKLWNPEAFGNDRYKTLVDQYFLLMKDEAEKKQGDLTISFPEMAAYLLEKHPELSVGDRNLALRFRDTRVKKTDEEYRLFNERLMSSYADEYVGIINIRFQYNSLMNTNDPDLRSLFLTRLLQEKVDNNEIAPVQPLIERYKRQAKGSPFKTAFLRKYEDLYKRTHRDALSIHSVIADAASLGEGSLFNDLTAKYKGKVVYIDIWATWCKPCLMEMKNARILREKFKGQDVVFVYLCINSPQEALWKKLIAAHAIEGENFLINDKQLNELNNRFSIGSIPRYLIVDRAGNVSNENASRPGSSVTLNEIRTLLAR